LLVTAFEDHLSRLEQLLVELELLDDESRGKVFELLDHVDAVHRLALQHLTEALDEDVLARVREDGAVAWLLDAYGAGADEREAADAALAPIRPYIHSHGGSVEVLHAAAGTVRVRLAGTCSGCTASAVTLQHGIEVALREGLPGFVALEVEETAAPAHPPPGPTLVQLTRFDA
jgi:Fe-S cluster biogenesis protein NfuA